MARLEFNDLQFSEHNDCIRATFLNLYYFDISKSDLLNLDEFMINKNSITFKNITEKKANNKFNGILSKGFNDLKFKLNKKKTVYIHQNSGIPLIGSNSFGLVDRDTNLIEIKPITGCNLNCIFCSVDEGKDSKKTSEFVVEKDYLVSEFRKLAQHKNCNPLYAYINVHGEPLLYAPIVELIRELKQTPNVVAGIITNGTSLNKKFIDDLKEAGLDRINISLNAFSKDKTTELAGAAYNFEKILEMIKYANTKLEVVVAPIYLHTLNEEDMDNIIGFIKSTRKGKKGKFPLLGIQNFLEYKLGRNPVKQLEWEKFNERIIKWEEKHKIDLREDEFYSIFETKSLQKPFRKGDIITADIVCNDRYPNQKIATAKGRSITIMNCAKTGGRVKLKIIRDKHNIFTAILS